MIFYFTGAFLMSLALMKLGSTIALLTVIEAVSKVALGLLALIAAVLLYRKFRGKPPVSRIQLLPNI